TTPLFAGVIQTIVRDIKGGNNYIRIDNTGGETIGENPFFLYVKNSVAESRGMLGKFMIFTLTNDDTERVELVSVGSEVMQSKP
ncbi:MAG: hypothetical protein WCY09_08580, partial [Candidatus Omnitrophota bacterium]